MKAVRTKRLTPDSSPVLPPGRPSPLGGGGALISPPSVCDFLHEGGKLQITIALLLAYFMTSVQLTSSKEKYRVASPKAKTSGA